jgi:hypothetical protein
MLFQSWRNWQARLCSCLLPALLLTEPSTVLGCPQVVQRKDRMELLLDDVALLHGLGVKLVLVCGAKPHIDEYLRAHGQEPRLVGAYRVTDELALQGALKAAGTISTEVSAHLSKVQQTDLGGARMCVHVRMRVCQPRVLGQSGPSLSSLLSGMACLAGGPQLLCG